MVWKKIQSDPLSMDYNAGYDVSYFGYHYDTGCIDFPKEKWEETYNNRIKNKLSRCLPPIEWDRTEWKPVDSLCDRWYAIWPPTIPNPSRKGRKHRRRANDNDVTSW